MRRRLLRSLPALALALGAWLAALGASVARAEDPTPSSPPAPTRVEVPAMKTSIYVGSVTLQTSVFARTDDAWAATYDARVFPWAFWSEHGDITITLPAADLERLTRGETVNFTGDARSHKGKPRTVTGRAEPADAHTGRIKVRIRVDGIELVFDGSYAFAP